MRRDHTWLLAAAITGTATIALPALTTAQDAGTITVLSSWASGNPTGDQFKKNAADFEAATGIHIEIEEVNNDDVDQVFEASSLAGEQKDIVVLNLTPSSADWLPDGLVVDATQLRTDWGLDPKILPDALAYWGPNGFPYQAFNWPFWYNTDLLAQAGVTTVPGTVDELIAAAGALRTAGLGPLVVGGAEWPVQNLTTWIGQQYLTPDEAKDIFANGGWCANPNAVKGLDLFGQLRDAGVFVDNVAGYTGDQMTNAYFSGEAAIMPSGSWAYTGASGENAKAGLDEVTELSGFPVVDGGTYAKPTAFQGFNTGFFLSTKGAEKLDLVQQFFQYMYSDEVLKGWVADANQILAVEPSTVAGAVSTAPLVVEGAALADSVDWLVLPDGYFPAGMDYQPAATEFIGTQGMTGAQFCQTLDALYQQ
jgi:multiple sugar transport system substrate-binding protein